MSPTKSALVKFQFVKEYQTPISTGRMKKTP